MADDLVRAVFEGKKEMSGRAAGFANQSIFVLCCVRSLTTKATAEQNAYLVVVLPASTYKYTIQVQRRTEKQGVSLLRAVVAEADRQRGKFKFGILFLTNK